MVSAAKSGVVKFHITSDFTPLPVCDTAAAAFAAAVFSVKFYNSILNQ